MMVCIIGSLGFVYNEETNILHIRIAGYVGGRGGVSDFGPPSASWGEELERKKLRERREREKRRCHSMAQLR